MATLARTVTVYFYAIDPALPKPKFAPGQYPVEDVLEQIRRLDPGAPEYRIPDKLFGGELLCILHEDGPEPLLGVYYVDKLHVPSTEYKGQIEQLILRDGEGLVDSSYSMFFPNDVLGLVRTSAKSPGFARLSQWLSVQTKFPVHLTSLSDGNPLGQIDQDPTAIRKLFLKIRRDKIGLFSETAPSIAQALRSAAQVSPYASTVGLQWQTESKQDYDAFSRNLRDQVHELVDLLPELQTAKVKLRGVKRELNLRRVRIATSVDLVLENRKHIGPGDAAQALVDAYRIEKAAIDEAVQIWRNRGET